MARQFKEQWQRLAIMASYDSKKLANLRGISPRQLQRIFRTQFGRTPQEWLNDERMMAAQKMLTIGASIKKVALDLGFKQSSHFCRKFKVVSGVTPKQFILTNIGREMWQTDGNAV